MNALCVRVCDGRAVTLISVSIVIPCLVHHVNASNSILPIILVGYHSLSNTYTHTHTHWSSLSAIACAHL